MKSLGSVSRIRKKTASVPSDCAASRYPNSAPGWRLAANSDALSSDANRTSSEVKRDKRPRNRAVKSGRLILHSNKVPSERHLLNRSRASARAALKDNSFL